MNEGLSRREFLEKAGSTLIGMVGALFYSNKASGKDTSSGISKTDIPLNEGSPLEIDEYIGFVKRTNNCYNTSSRRCSYVESGNCSGCIVVQEPVTKREVVALFEPMRKGDVKRITELNLQR